MPTLGGMQETSKADWWDARVTWQLTPLSEVSKLLSLPDLSCVKWLSRDECKAKYVALPITSLKYFLSWGCIR